MSTEDHGRESAAPPPPPDGPPKPTVLGAQLGSQGTVAPGIVGADSQPVQELTNRGVASQRFEPAAEPPTLQVLGPGPRGNVVKAISAVIADAGGQRAAAPESGALGEAGASERAAMAGVPSVCPPVAPGTSPSIRTERNSEADIPLPPPGLHVPAAQVEGSRRHIRSAIEIPLDLEAQRRVIERCGHRRNRTELTDFPVGAKSGWLDRLFHWTGRILVERCTESEADCWRQAWFIGDVHGDLVGLLAALDFIRHQQEYSKERDIIVLLGDLIDDLPESESVLAEVSEAIGAEERLVVIVGNHDDALEHSDTRGFGASVDPCDYCEYLKGIADGGPEHPSLRFAQSFISYMRDAPVALFLNDGTMAAHGGVPHTDLAEQVAGGGWGEDHRVWSDFIWARLHPRAKSRMAVSGTRSRELGAEDFRRFASTVKSQLGFEPVRMIRGHDHIDARFEIYGGKWQDSVLTINNMSWKLPRETGVDGPRNPCIARWTRGEPIQPFVILMDSEWRASMQPRTEA